MVTVKRYMYPVYWQSLDGSYKISFMTSDGRRHRCKLHKTRRDGLYKFRFRGSTWSTGLKVIGPAQMGGSGFVHSY